MSRLFPEIPPIMTRCDKMWQDVTRHAELPQVVHLRWRDFYDSRKLAKACQNHSNIQENMRVRRDFLNKAMLHPSWSHPCPRPLNPQPAPTCRYACKKSSFGERERSVQNRERKNSLDVKHNSYNSDMLQSYSIHWSMTQSVWLLELEFICPQTESMSMDSPPYDLNAGLFNLAKSW